MSLLARILFLCGVVAFSSSGSAEETKGAEHSNGCGNATNKARTQQISQSVMPRVSEPKLHAAELLSYVTVRLICLKADGTSLGTGFFYDIPHAADSTLYMPVVVSNRHVVKNVLKTIMVFTLAGPDNLPSTETYICQVDNRMFPWVDHPNDSVELSVLPLASALRDMESKGKKPFFFALNSSHIPDDEYLKSVTQTDDVIMIGYPGGLWDNVNNQPIFRKGILATSPRKDFCGRREFLIDMPVYCGSSGSPVLLFSEGAFPDRGRGNRSGGIAFGGRLKLLGVNYATITNTVNGRVVPVPVPTVADADLTAFGITNNYNRAQKFSLEAKVGIPNNIGIIIHASRLKEIEEMFADIIRRLPNNGVGH